MGRKLYVGNLPYSAGEQDLQDLFAACGQVESVSVMRDMATGRARGFAFVEMATDADAQKAITELHDKSFGGRNLTVNEARPRTERSGGFGGDRGGGGGGGRRRESRW
jgi:cold-inducible RNA-binding protein